MTHLVHHSLRKLGIVACFIDSIACYDQSVTTGHNIFTIIMIVSILGSCFGKFM